MVKMWEKREERIINRLIVFQIYVNNVLLRRRWRKTKSFPNHFTAYYKSVFLLHCDSTNIKCLRTRSSVLWTANQQHPTINYQPSIGVFFIKTNNNPTTMRNIITVDCSTTIYLQLLRDRFEWRTSPSTPSRRPMATTTYWCISRRTSRTPCFYHISSYINK